MTSNLDEFIATIARLRAPDGCPWDKEQDHRSLARYLLEETYEVLEAVHADDPVKLKEELGDVLLQVVLNAQVAKDEGTFDIQDVARTINEKMVKRHPHVFGEKKLDTANQVRQQWDEIKANERGDDDNKSVVDQVPNALPALLKALKVSEKAVGQGFEWRTLDEVWEKVQSELAELKEALDRPPEEQDQREIELELGDVMFTLVNVARWKNLNPEESLLLAIDKFRLRFRKMEEISEQPLKSLSKDELYDLWVEAKASV